MAQEEDRSSWYPFPVSIFFTLTSLDAVFPPNQKHRVIHEAPASRLRGFVALIVRLAPGNMDEDIWYVDCLSVYSMIRFASQSQAFWCALLQSAPIGFGYACRVHRADPNTTNAIILFTLQ